MVQLIKNELSEIKLFILIWIASKLPDSIIYFAIVDALVYASTGKYSNEPLSSITALELLKRWDDKGKGKNKI